MIPTTGMHDVDDVEGFVAACMARSGIRFADDEREELLAEGLAIMARLACDFEPHRPGYATSGRFSGYAAAMLPRRLYDAWKRLHPEHLERRHGNHRTLEYGELPASLDAPASARTTQTLGDMIPDPRYRPGLPEDGLIDQAMALLPLHQRMVAYGLVDGLSEGRGVTEIAADLGVGRQSITDARLSMASAIGFLLQRRG